MTEHFERQVERQKKRTDEDYDEGTIDDFFFNLTVFSNFNGFLTQVLKNNWKMKMRRMFIHCPRWEI